MSFRPVETRGLRGGGGGVFAKVDLLQIDND